MKLVYTLIWLFPLYLSQPIAVAQSQDYSLPPSQTGSFLTNKDILQMLSSGLSPEIIKAKIINSKCLFDTSPEALAALQKASAPDSVILAMVSAPIQPKANVAPVNESSRQIAIREEKETARTRCPGCQGIMIASFDGATGSFTEDWVTPNQREYLKERADKIKKSGAAPHFWMTKYRENADYVIVWSRSTGSRAYTTYIPQTSTSNTSITGDVNATATTQTTTYRAQQNEWNFVNFVATVYGQDGRKKYEILHQGNFRWSKPDKDCLEDAFKFLLPKP